MNWLNGVKRMIGNGKVIQILQYQTFGWERMMTSKKGTNGLIVSNGI